MKFKVLSGDINWETYGGKWISPKLNNGEFDYWIVLEFTNWPEVTGELIDGHKYHVQLSSVSPSEAGKENIDKAFSCCGMSDEQLERFENDPVAQVEALDSYGVKAPLWQATGNNIRKLMTEARKQARLCEGLYGFYMDGAKNRIGSTGWEFQRGDLNSALNRAMSQDTTEASILRKMHGVDQAG